MNCCQNGDGKQAMIIGVLALQGDFAKHEEMLRSLGVAVKQVRQPQDLEACDGLIIPGGESTTLFRQIDFIKMREALTAFAKNKPVFGTCAGLILMSHEIQSSPFKPLNLLNITIERNAFGKQIDSFHAPIVLQFDKPTPFDAFFIRAPQISLHGPGVEVLADYHGRPVLVKQGIHLGASFHPELTSNPIVHNYFIKMISRK